MIVNYIIVLLIGVLLIVLSFNWVMDLFIEWSVLGFCTSTESICLLIGFKLFILSEFILFGSCFWYYLNCRLIVYSFISIPFYPLITSLFTLSFSIPLSNLLILLYSSFSLQATSLFVKLGIISYTVECLGQTLCCGCLFLTLQLKEFVYSLFSMSDSMIGSIYYFTTGLHGLHVIIGGYGFFILLFFLFS